MLYKCFYKIIKEQKEFVQNYNTLISLKCLIKAKSDFKIF